MNRTSLTRSFLLALGALVAVPAAAQQSTAAPQTPTAAAPPVQIERYTVGSARPPVVEGSKLLELSLEQAQQIALEKNLDLKVARMNPQMQDYAIQQARATFIPRVTGSYSYRDSQSASNNTLEGVSTLTSVNQGFNGGISQTLPWYGASYSASFTNGRNATNDITRRVNPQYSSGVSLSFNMPLLNGFRIDGTRNNLRTLAIQRQITDIQLLASIENTKNQVRTAYWNLRSAIEQIEITRRALEIAKKQWDDSLLRVEIGNMAPIDTVQFETAHANADQSHLAAQISWRTAELNFKRLLVTGIDDELYGMTINPIDKPSLSVQSVDIQAAVTRALAERTDIVISRRNIDSSRLGLEVTKGALLPDLNFSAGYSSSGQGGPTRVGNTIIPGGYLDALRAAYGFELPTWNIGFNFTYPIGMRSAKAQYARALIQLDQSLAQVKSQELTISTAVINAGLNVENTYKLYQASVKAREAAERNADANQVRFDNGMLTNFEVVQGQQQLTNARLQELSRLIAYMNALAEFERVQKVG
jgi:outer membrane protein TolC